MLIKNDFYTNYYKMCYFFKNSPYIAAKLILNKMNTGTVKFFNESKGFGFIKDNDSSKEYFVHVSGLIDKISENDEVTFDIQEGKKGLNAVNVKRA
jgi:cold shock protein